MIELYHSANILLWIMTGRRGSVGETNVSVLDRIKNIGVDGVLINDLDLAVDWANR